jgi:hypothetical protein
MQNIRSCIGRAPGGASCAVCPYLLSSATLPVTTEVQNWSLAWTGLDGGEAIAALATADITPCQ